MIVVDASVAAKWVLAEPDRDAAKALLGNDRKLIAPSVIRFEVTGAILRRFRKNELDEKTARFACQEWDELLHDLVIELVPSEELFVLARDLAFKARHSLSDCLYLAAAKSHSAEVVTADVTLRDRGKKLYPRITLLQRAAVAN
ncbi:MAG: type II toxin-antitoxin system VapC family toxin [Phycisphaerae bacterium]|nr:type II toxin-antitoxin system VapC family toxin [Phycisphaerae bacterium]